MKSLLICKRLIAILLVIKPLLICKRLVAILLAIKPLLASKRLVAILLAIKPLLASKAKLLSIKPLLASKCLATRLRRKTRLRPKVLLVTECILECAIRLLWLRQRQEIGRKALVPVVIRAHILLVILVAITGGQGRNASHTWIDIYHFIRTLR